MALIKCYECSREISDKAPACVHCGAPKKKVSASLPREATPANTPASTNGGGPSAGALMVFVVALIVVFVISRAAGENARSPDQRSTTGNGEPPAAASQMRFITGCDFNSVDSSGRVTVAVERVNIWETVDNGRMLGSLRGVDPSEPRYSPGWCVGEPVTVLSRRVDRSGRNRARIRTSRGTTGWVTSDFILNPN